MSALLPLVMSLKASGASAAIAYNSGFSQPSDLLLFAAAMLTWFSWATTTANSGEDSEVPSSAVTSPATTTPTPLPYMATSGTALLLGLK